MQDLVTGYPLNYYLYSTRCVGGAGPGHAGQRNGENNVSGFFTYKNSSSSISREEEEPMVVALYVSGL